MKHRSCLCAVVAITLLAACQREGASTPAPPAGVTEVAVTGNVPDAPLDALRKALAPAQERAQERRQVPSEGEAFEENFRRWTMPLAGFVEQTRPR